MIASYFRSADGGKHLSAHFTVAEFACRDGSEPVFVDERLVLILETIRARFARPLRIHSGYRTPGYNQKVGGAARSQHLLGTAADVSITGVTPAEVARFARELMPDWGGVGTYPTFTHIDVRPTRSDWKGT